ncbi:MAG: TatD family hydrolase [Oscillospiraceae bacterium]|nr:TatD family hydrolase [Oscillospiraceae bacterium]
MYFDTHAHYNDKRYNDDREQLMEELAAAGVTHILNASYSLSSAKYSLGLAENFSPAGNYPSIYVSIGVHPHDAKTMNDNTVAELEKLLSHPKAVAVGEIGLDYYYDHSPRDVQQKRFVEQLALARRVKLPVVIHMRDATEDTLRIMNDFKDLSCVFHCFPGSWETAEIILDMGWYLSFTGVVTFKNARRALEVIEKMPEDRLLLETDCPYMSPEPFRGKRNSSLYLPYIAAKIAEVRGVATEDIANLTMENGKRFFGIV